ncbi:hypothetical protein ACGFW5_17850 [Streptomyces sp. NPDC048416]|uniref:Orn/Lys/Arg family decarboxylase n=1 Tax=Streptomyces sp. NPDC048416 TaxID=3365546 RepID=UPI00372252E3
MLSVAGPHGWARALSRARCSTSRATWCAPKATRCAPKSSRTARAEMLTPYPPGIPAVLPGERIDADIVRYLRSGVDAGMVVPDAVDTEVRGVRVVAR